MPDDINEHVAQEFHGLVSDLQHNDVQRFEEEIKKEREVRAALRKAQPDPGLSAGELLKKLDGDPEDDRKKVLDELARIGREAQAAAAQKTKQNEALPAGRFPPPPGSE